MIEIYSALWWKFPTCLSQLHFTCPWDRFEGKCFFEFLRKVAIIRSLKRNCLALVQKELKGFVTTAFYVFIERFWGKIGSKFFESFSDLEQKFFWLLATFFRQGCYNCILRVHGNKMRKYLYLFFFEVVLKFLVVQSLSQKRSCFCRNVFRWVVETVFSMS